MNIYEYALATFHGALVMTVSIVHFKYTFLHVNMNHHK